jgi:hypothetical protein
MPCFFAAQACEHARIVRAARMVRDDRSAHLAILPRAYTLR